MFRVNWRPNSNPTQPNINDFPYKTSLHSNFQSMLWTSRYTVFIAISDDEEFFEEGSGLDSDFEGSGNSEIYDYEEFSGDDETQEWIEYTLNDLKSCKNYKFILSEVGQPKSLTSETSAKTPCVQTTTASTTTTTTTTTTTLIPPQVDPIENVILSQEPNQEGTLLKLNWDLAASISLTVIIESQPTGRKCSQLYFWEVVPS